MTTDLDIETELARLGSLGLEGAWYLFGGCAMTIGGWKSATKDVDVVVDEPIPVIASKLEELGFDAWEEVWSLDDDSFTIMNRGEFRIDLFPARRIFDGPGFTDTMKRRATHWKTFGALKIFIADASTMFFFKAMTGRWAKEPMRDLEDLETFAKQGAVDWQWIQAEWDAFEGKARVVEKVQEALAFLKAEGYFVGWRP